MRSRRLRSQDSYGLHVLSNAKVGVCTAADNAVIWLQAYFRFDTRMSLHLVDMPLKRWRPKPWPEPRSIA